MPPVETPAAKPNEPSSSREIAAKGGNLADLLNALDNGVRITGTVLLVEEPRHVSGTSGKGRAYDFWNVRLQIWTGNKAVECTIRRDKEADFPVIPQGEKATFRVVNGRMRDGAMCFDIEP